MVNMKYVHEILHYVLVCISIYTIRMNSQDVPFYSAAGILFQKIKLNKKI